MFVGIWSIFLTIIVSYQSSKFCIVGLFQVNLTVFLDGVDYLKSVTYLGSGNGTTVIESDV